MWLMLTYGGASPSRIDVESSRKIVVAFPKVRVAWVMAEKMVGGTQYIHPGLSTREIEDTELPIGSPRDNPG